MTVTIETTIVVTCEDTAEFDAIGGLIPDRDDVDCTTTQADRERTITYTRTREVT